MHDAGLRLQSRKLEGNVLCRRFRYIVEIGTIGRSDDGFNGLADLESRRMCSPRCFLHKDRGRVEKDV
jgi:hypothetical protein